MKHVIALMVLVAGMVPSAASAQHQPTPAPALTPSHMKHGDSFDQFLFPPELVMQRQRDLALTPQQRTTITEAVKALQSGVVDLQWQIQDEQQKLHELLALATVNETAALAQVDRVLDLERSIKKLHLQMLIRVKGALTHEQQEKLKAVDTHLEFKRDHEGIR
jgi:Spy/CpxP family protein refolding chaperone